MALTIMRLGTTPEQSPTHVSFWVMGGLMASLHKIRNINTLLFLLCKVVMVCKEAEPGHRQTPQMTRGVSATPVHLVGGHSLLIIEEESAAISLLFAAVAWHIKILRRSCYLQCATQGLKPCQKIPRSVLAITVGEVAIYAKCWALRSSPSGMPARPDSRSTHVLPLPDAPTPFGPS